jgi:hypothetical protein
MRLECVQNDVVITRIWHGIPDGAPVMLTHLPDYGTYHRLVVDAGTLGWDEDTVFRNDGILVRFVTGHVQGELTDQLKPAVSPEGNIALEGGQATAVATGRFIEVVASGKSPEHAELQGRALLGLLALALGQNVLGKVVFSEPWVAASEEQLGEAVALGSEVPRQTQPAEFDEIDALIERVTHDGQMERVRIISLGWYERGFRAREPLEILLSFYIGLESLVAAFSKSSAPSGPVNQDDHWTVADPEDVEAVGDSRHSALPLHAASILGVFSSGRSRASPILDNNACEPWRTSAALRGFGSRRSVFQRTSATLSRRVTWPLLTARLSVRVRPPDPPAGLEPETAATI